MKKFVIDIMKHIKRGYIQLRIYPLDMGFTLVHGVEFLILNQTVKYLLQIFNTVII